MLTDNKYIIFKESGRLGNALFRYFASALLSIKYEYLYILKEKYNTTNNFIFYKGLDHTGDDIYRLNINDLNIELVKNHILNDNNAISFNTLGFVKNNVDIDNLFSNEYINNENGHGLYVKNIVNINDNNFLSQIKIFIC